jgi:hypothetical protein
MSDRFFIHTFGALEWNPDSLIGFSMHHQQNMQSIEDDDQVNANYED